MRTNISFNIGTLILINKIDKEYNLFDSLFRNIKGKTKHLIESAKTFINNRLDKCTSLNQIIPTYPTELFECLGFKESPKERTLYRDLERIGLNYKFVIEEYQKLLKKSNLVDKEQFVDFSSSYFEGEKAALMYDPLTVYSIINPMACEKNDYNILVETTGEITRGMTVAELRKSKKETPNITVVERISEKDFKQDFIRILSL